MAKIIMSDEYYWGVSPDLFALVRRLLAERVEDEETRHRLASVSDTLNVPELPPAVRDEVLRVFRTEIVEAVAAALPPDYQEMRRSSTIGHVKVLRLMANDI